MDERPNYYAIIPADVRYDEHIQPNAKLLYGEISALANEHGYCFARNSYFAGIYKMSERTIRGLLASLNDAGYISIILEKSGNGQEVIRKIYLKMSTPDGQAPEKIFLPPGKNFPDPPEKIFRYNNTSNNNNIYKENKKESPESEAPVSAGGKRPPKEDFRPEPLFEEWIRMRFPDEPSGEKNALYIAFVRFAANRKEIKKPFKSKAAITALCNKLMQYASGDLLKMADLLDTATVHNWQSIYPERQDTQSSTQKPRRDEEWL